MTYSMTYMQHIQGVALYLPVKSHKDRTRGKPVEVVVLAHGQDGLSSIQFSDGSIQRVSTQFLTMKKS